MKVRFEASEKAVFDAVVDVLWRWIIEHPAEPRVMVTDVLTTSAGDKVYTLSVG